MPLLCISLLALLLLPPSLSCNSTTQDLHDKHLEIVLVDLDNARGNITSLLRNVPCQDYNLPNCTSENISLVSTLFRLTCKMKNLGIPHTETLTTSVLDSIDCSCERSTKNPKVKLRKRTATGEKRNEQRRIKKLCRAKAMLSNMTECYQILNAQPPKT